MAKKLEETAPRPTAHLVVGAGMKMNDLSAAGDPARARRLEASYQDREKKVAPSPPPPAAIQKDPAREMLSTPIASALRQMLRDLKFYKNISQAFTVETALKDFFANRTMDEVAADLRSRGGRLRRRS